MHSACTPALAACLLLLSMVATLPAMAAPVSESVARQTPARGQHAVNTQSPLNTNLHGSVKAEAAMGFERDESENDGASKTLPPRLPGSNDLTNGAITMTADSASEERQRRVRTAESQAAVADTGPWAEVPHLEAALAVGSGTKTTKAKRPYLTLWGAMAVCVAVLLSAVALGVADRKKVDASTSASGNADIPGEASDANGPAAKRAKTGELSHSHEPGHVAGSCGASHPASAAVPPLTVSSASPAPVCSPAQTMCPRPHHPSSTRLPPSHILHRHNPH